METDDNTILPLVGKASAPSDTCVCVMWVICIVRNIVLKQANVE